MLCLNPLIPLITTPVKSTFPPKFSVKKSSRVFCSQSIPPNPQQEQQLNLSVLRFTLGIPGLDESYLPRYIGYAFGALLVLNHFVGSDSSSITAAQLRTEALGISMAGFSIVVPFLGKFLKGATRTDQKIIPEGSEQIFGMSEDIADTLREDLAWGTYVLLRNTNSISALISVRDALCVRGYWNMPKDISKENVLDWFAKQVERIDLKDSMSFKEASESELSEIVPDGTRSFLVQPILESPKENSGETQEIIGFLLLASSIDYAYNDNDRAWIAAIANKFRG